MTGQRGRLGRAAVRAALGLLTTAATVVLWAPTAAATPESDAADAISAAWDAAGGDNSELGARQGDVYPIGEGFAEDFAGGKMFYTPATGARAMYGAVLQKYESLGGPADSDLGFPNVDEAPGLASPDSRSITFDAADHPVLFYTPEHGAFVVRGAINAAWDKLGSSSGTLGVPVADETTDGDVITQKFSGGQVSWNRVTKAFSTDPPELAGDLKDLQVPIDATASINRAWRAAGGASGPLGAKQGDQYTVGTDGAGQDFAGGKVFFSPATGANAVSGDVLAKYESLGGPAGSDLGFPVSSEADGPIPGSRVSTFSGEDKPVIFFSPDHGAFVVRGAMKVAWDKLGGASGKLGAPVGDQSVDGNVVSQKFTGGTISWDRVANRFSTDPENLAGQLAGLQVPGQNAPSGPALSHHGGGGTGPGWHWWWLAVALAALVLLPLLAGLWWQRRRKAERFLLRRNGRRRATAGAVANGAAPGIGYDAEDDERWSAEAEEPGTTVRLSRFPAGYGEEPGGYGEEPGGYGEEPGGPPSGVDLFGGTGPDDSWMPTPGGSAGGFGEAPVDDAEADELEEAEDPDAVDTAPTRIPTSSEVQGAPEPQTGRHAALGAADDDAPESPGYDGEAYPAVHLPLDDPYQAPEGYPVKANTVSGLYYTPDSPAYFEKAAEIWFASEEVAQFNGFVKAD
ncbi:LGFP repeat-containing protein [Mycobacterium sp. pUA109]|uniref:LGFP repeat-containing protein n=1 Tax=Mycobacterium sp. pUA109 TaxID=3238982 RepID=UPI00351B6391